MKSKTSGPVLWFRQLLQIDGWGKDLFRIKRRLADQVFLNEIRDTQLDIHSGEIGDLTESVGSLETEVEQLQSQVESLTLALEIVNKVLAVHNEIFEALRVQMQPPAEAPKRQRRSSTIMEKGAEALQDADSAR